MRLTCAPDPLLNLLVTKRLLTTEEARTILSAGDPESQRDLLAILLKDKGLISAAEFDQLRATASNSTAVNAAAASQERPGAVVNSAPIPSQKPSVPSVIAAVAPIRLLPIDVPQREGLIRDLKLGSGARIKP